MPVDIMMIIILMVGKSIFIRESSDHLIYKAKISMPYFNSMPLSENFLSMIT
jgi:hypothetical protein